MIKLMIANTRKANKIKLNYIKLNCSKNTIKLKELLNCFVYWCSGSHWQFSTIYYLSTIY